MTSNGNGAPQKTYPTIWDDGPSNAPQPVKDSQPDALKVEVQQKHPGSTPDETDPAKIAAHNEVAQAALRQKNRKRKHGPKMELPFDPTMEPASMWQLTGFAPNFDGKWLVHEVIFTFTGKGGARMEIDLLQPPEGITSPAAPPTIAQKRKLLNNSNVGAEPNPVPVNLGFGGKNQSWLPEVSNVAMASRK
jgi:hypothetical protein